MRLIQLFIFYIMATAFSSCAQSGSSSSSSSDSDSTLLVQKLLTYQTKAAKLGTTHKKPVREKGIHGIWINLKLKNYLLRDSVSVDGESLLPLTLTVDQKGAYFTFRYEGPVKYNKITANGTGKFSIGKFNAVLKNDSVVSVAFEHKTILFERSTVDKNNMADFTALLNDKLFSYAKLRQLVNLNGPQADTMNIRAAKSNLTDEVLCSTLKTNFKYRITYAYPFIFDKSFTPAVYYLNSTGLEDKPVTYEISLVENEVQLRDLNTREVRYKFLY